MRLLRLLLAWLGPASVHFVTGRPVRGAVWVGLTVATILAAPWVGAMPVLAVELGQVIDAAIIRPRRERRVYVYFLGALISACIWVFVAVTFKAVWVEAFRIPSGSSIPTLLVGDHIFAAKWERHPGRGDTIVFKYPKEPNKDFIKRVIAVGGDTIEIRDDVVFVNDRPIPRRPVDGECHYDDFSEEIDDWETRACQQYEEELDGHRYRVVFDARGRASSMPPRTVPPDHLFVIGDNRDNSHDSRYWGFLPIDHVRGTARIVWWSFGRDGARWERINQRIR
jgi:signal peptidase I